MPEIETNGIKMHYEVHGEGEPVICIMGITASNEVWEPHVEEWKKHFQCITPDNRGVGCTEKPEIDYTSEMMADDIAGLMDGAGIDSAHVVGCSMGSIVGQQLALRHPAKVRKLVLMCPWARCDRHAKSIFSHLEKIKAHLTADDFMEYIQLLIFDKSSWDDEEFYQSMLEGREEALENDNPQPLHGLAGQAAACVNHDVYEQLPTITNETLIIGGMNDIFTPRWMAEEIHSQLPHSELFLYKNAGHGFHFENVEDFNRRVLEFLARG
ncbi:MAG: alpha/beta hydrolase [Verrucomicrobiota bacterium JB023]|nr:alpha/beta hydrolase [Verrucomicrobiota bacterium JB023]